MLPLPLHPPDEMRLQGELPLLPRVAVVRTLCVFSGKGLRLLLSCKTCQVRKIYDKLFNNSRRMGVFTYFDGDFISVVLMILLCMVV